MGGDRDDVRAVARQPVAAVVQDRRHLDAGRVRAQYPVEAESWLCTNSLCRVCPTTAS